MSSMNLLNDYQNMEQIGQLERMLGKGLMMPFNASNSGSRKLMFGTHQEHKLALVHPEVAYIQTGYEKEFGKYSSSFINVAEDIYVLGKVEKFSNRPKHHYFIITLDDKSKTLGVIERKEYKHITESYGYIYNNEVLDHLNKGDYIGKGTVILKSTSFDEYNNRQDGRNLLVSYGSSEETMEDGIIISKSAAEKMSSPLIYKVPITINENEIPLNMYGDNTNYKIFPDIGEHIKDGILCGIRVEKKEEILFSQSWSRLRDLFISDQPYIVSGVVVDVTINPNNISLIETNQYYSQIYRYYQDMIRMCREIVEIVDPYIKDGYKLSYELEKLYFRCTGILEGKQFFSERVYNNLTMEIVVMEEISIHRGDKISNRFGGKGVISCVKPDEEMPRTKDGRVFDIILNMCGVFGRENLGQLFEVTASFVSLKLLQFCQMGVMDVSQTVEYYLDFLRIVAPKMCAYVTNLLDGLSDEDLFNYISSMLDDESIFLIIEPMSENMTIDTVSQLYKEFPCAKPERVLTPIKDSMGNIRYVESRRPIVYGYQYFYRLKQYAEEKFSVTSLSSTNIRNENSRNKASNSYKALFPRTPIRFGDMETGNLNHLGADLIVQILMMYSTSPHARKTKDLLTGDPFNIDVKLDNQSVNRNAEILNVYLKEIGLRLNFIKKKKEKIYPLLINPISYDSRTGLINPLTIYDKNIPKEVIERDLKELLKREKDKKIYPLIIEPISFDKPINK